MSGQAMNGLSTSTGAAVGGAPQRPPPGFAPARPAAQGAHYLVISAHDYRTPRRTSLHFIADELAKRGRLRFFSLRYSALSRRTGDMRLGLDERANRVEEHRGVECFLWKTPIHPFNTRRPLLRPLEDLLFWLYEHAPSRVLVDWLASADVIIFESGLAPIFFDLACALNPAAKKIYRASDDLATIRVADYVHRRFVRNAPRFDAICMLSPRLAQRIPSAGNLYYVPNGVDDSLDAMGDPSPYGAGRHAVSVGSMLFDPGFFEIASQAFPAVTFHVIGSGHSRSPGYGDNVVLYGDMAYAETLRYIKHASFGIAPYVSDEVPAYLADSSMKLLQYDYFGLPSVCPHAVVGGYRSRFGYRPGDPAAILAAVGAALGAPRERFRKCLKWAEVTDRVLAPQDFADTAVAGPRSPPGKGRQ
jgi:2-beta-glucuronyltransferase